MYHSNGEVLILTRQGKVLCRLTGRVATEDVSRATFSHAVAGMAFLPPEKGEEEEEGRLVGKMVNYLLHVL